MPALAAVAVRYLLIAAMQIAAFEVAQRVLDSALAGVRDLLVALGIESADSADAQIASEILAAGGALGANAVLIKSRLPLRLTDRLKTASTRSTLSPRGSAVGGKALSAAQSKALQSGLRSKFGGALLISFATSIPWLPSLVQNFLDQGTFNPTNANIALRAIGLGSVFQWPEKAGQLQPGTYTSAEFNELYSQLTAAGAKGINATYASQSQIWSKENLADAINYIVGTKVLLGEKSDKTAIKAALAEYVIGATGTAPTPAPSGSSAGGTSGTSATKPPVNIKIFTGVVANGALGTPAEFVSRPDDMIQNTDELKLAAAANLAPLITSLPGRFFYEISIANSVKTAAGTTIKGDAVRVVSGYNANGSPRYKTVYNKFAVMKVGVTDAKGKNVLLNTITLGPVNSTEFNPTNAQLADMTNTIPADLFTSNIGDISQINTPSGVAVNTNPVSPPAPPANNSIPAGSSAPPSQEGTAGILLPSQRGSISLPGPAVVNTPGSSLNVRSAPGLSAAIIGSLPHGTTVQLLGDGGPADNFVWYKISFNGATGYIASEYLQSTAKFGTTGPTATPSSSNSSSSTTTSSPSANAPAPSAPALSSVQLKQKAASNLSEWYGADGRSVPSISSRAFLYQSFGLGASATYAGTAEQNNRLLVELKRQAGLL